MNFFDRLRLAITERQSHLCVGLDPDPERISGGASGALKHCREVVRQTSDHVCCYKPNAAYWEQYGAAGWEALAELRAIIPPGILLLYDAKRGDIGSTMRAYARSSFENLKMDAMTAQAYGGLDSLAEITTNPSRGIYIWCQSSNSGSADLQQRSLDGAPLWLRVAELAERANRNGNIGLVASATYPEQISRLRAHTKLPFLIPGVGAQGGDLRASIVAAWSGDPASTLIPTSRAILYAEQPGAAAAALQTSIN
ncbi:MAG: orotidine-5'-phosphate decarboxylase, partial [Candidatus Dormibacteraceae bacterium]